MSPTADPPQAIVLVEDSEGAGVAASESVDAVQLDANTDYVPAVVT